MSLPRFRCPNTTCSFSCSTANGLDTHVFMTHDGVQQNDGRRSKRRRLLLQPSLQLGGLGDRLPVDRMTDQLNYEDDEEDGHYMSTVESTIPADLLERPRTLFDVDDIEENMGIHGMMDELFSISQTVGDNACNKILSVFTKCSGKVEQFIKLYKNMDDIRECLKRRTKNKLLKICKD